MWRPVSFAALIRPTSFAVRVCSRLYRLTSAGDLGFAPITRPKLTQNLPQPLEQSLHARAIRVCNREPRAIARYMSIHLNLHRGR